MDTLVALRSRRVLVLWTLVVLDYLFDYVILVVRIAVAVAPRPDRYNGVLLELLDVAMDLGF
jgi:hypothetical protein